MTEMRRQCEFRLVGIVGKGNVIIQRFRMGMPFHTQLLHSLLHSFIPYNQSVCRSQTGNQAHASQQKYSKINNMSGKGALSVVPVRPALPAHTPLTRSRQVSCRVTRPASSLNTLERTRQVVALRSGPKLTKRSLLSPPSSVSFPSHTLAPLGGAGCEPGISTDLSQNVTSSSVVNSVLEAARDIKSPIILQLSQGGAAFFAGKGLKNENQEASIAGAVAAAHFIRSIAPSYGV